MSVKLMNVSILSLRNHITLLRNHETSHNLNVTRNPVMSPLATTLLTTSSTPAFFDLTIRPPGYPLSFSRTKRHIYTLKRKM